jgi:hypothetical protein
MMEIAGAAPPESPPRRAGYVQNALYLICALAAGQLLVLHHLEGGQLSEHAHRRELQGDMKERIALQIRVNAAKLQIKTIDDFDDNLDQLDARTQAAGKSVHPKTLAQASLLKNSSREAYARLQQDLLMLQGLEEKMLRAATHEQIERDVSAAIVQVYIIKTELYSDFTQYRH